MKIHSYLQYYDGGFNPNVDGHIKEVRICTMAQCCPELRERAEVGDWLIGFSAPELSKDHENVKMIHAMQVTQKVTLSKYEQLVKRIDSLHM